MSEATIKRIESGESLISLHVLLAMEELGLTTQMLSSGKLAFEEDLDRSAFKIANPYFCDRYTGGRLVNIYRAYYVSKLGLASWNSLLLSIGVDPLRFVNENNSTSALLSHRVIQELAQQGAFSSNDLLAFSRIAQKLMSISPLVGCERDEQMYYLDLFVAKTKDFERNTDWKILDRYARETYIEIVPREHMDVKYIFRNDRIAPGAMEEWFRALASGCGSSVEIKESLYKGDKRCLLKVS